MNKKFYSLPVEKQQKIINAGFHVFSQNSYKKSPMNGIANCVGISKSLLFHYFHSKHELYLFRWDIDCKITAVYSNLYVSVVIAFADATLSMVSGRNIYDFLYHNRQKRARVQSSENCL